MTSNVWAVKDDFKIWKCIYDAILKYIELAKCIEMQFYSWLMNPEWMNLSIIWNNLKHSDFRNVISKSQRNFIFFLFYLTKYFMQKWTST